MTAPTSIKKLAAPIATWSLVVVAVLAAVVLYSRWTARPWTRDGQVRADIIKIAPQVAGYLEEVAVTDNQFVRKGDLLFQIDQSDYQLAVDKSKVALDQTREEVASLTAAVEVAKAQLESAKVAVISAERKIEAAAASVDSAEAAVESARAGVTAAKQLIKQRNAEVENAKSEATRAKRLVEKQAGSIEDAESTAATSIAREAQLEGARAGLVQAKASLSQAEASLSTARVQLLVSKDALAEAKAAEESAQAAVDQAQANLGSEGDSNVRVRTAMANLAQAELDLSRTRIASPCDGYISNLSVDEGAYAAVGQPLVAVVNSNSFRVHAYFQETKLPNVKPGTSVMVTLMSHPRMPLEGVVENIGSAVNPPNIAPTEGQPGEIPQIQPTFDWVRLPQRVPVRVRLVNVPDEIQLISGTTASVAVTGDSK